MDNERHEQILRQHRVVAHLANTLSLLHFELADLHRHTETDGALEMAGDRTARLMELLGDTLNGMDAVSDTDAWMNPIFHKAHELWPQTTCPHCGHAQETEIGCPCCHGTGETYAAHDLLARSPRDQAEYDAQLRAAGKFRCPMCGGTGKRSVAAQGIEALGEDAPAASSRSDESPVATNGSDAPGKRGG